MSISLMTRIFQLDLGSCPRKMLAIKLADHADDDGLGIWPSVERLAKACNLSTRTIQRTLADFVDEEILIVVKRGGRGTGSTTRYDFNLKKLSKFPNSLGDRVSPKEFPKGDTGGAEGDSDGNRERLDVTQTIKKPSDNHHSSSADAPEKEILEDLGKEFEIAWLEYDNRLKSSRGKSFDEWCKLTPQERLSARKRIPVFKATWKESGGTPSMIPVFSTYLGDRRFEQVRDPDVVLERIEDGRKLFMYGKAWGVVRLAVLRTTPIAESGDGLWEPKRSYARQPFLRSLDGPTMIELDPNRTVPRKLLDACVKVRVGSSEWHAWSDYHTAKHWLFIRLKEDTKFVWFPARLPEEWKSFEAVEGYDPKIRSDYLDIES